MQEMTILFLLRVGFEGLVGRGLLFGSVEVSIVGRAVAIVVAVRQCDDVGGREFRRTIPSLACRQAKNRRPGLSWLSVFNRVLEL